MNYHAKCPKKGRTAEKPKNWFWRCSVPENLRVVRRLVPIATFVFIWRKGWWNRFSRSNEMVNEREMEILRWRTPNTANHDRSILAVHRIPESARPKQQTATDSESESPIIRPLPLCSCCCFCIICALHRLLGRRLPSATPWRACSFWPAFERISCLMVGG